METSTCAVCERPIHKAEGGAWQHEPPLPRHIATPAPDFPAISTMSDVWNEVVRARELFPSAQHQTVALMEEVGELSEALLKGHSSERIREEAIQVAAMAIRIAEEGDANFQSEGTSS